MDLYLLENLKLSKIKAFHTFVAICPVINNPQLQPENVAQESSGAIEMPGCFTFILKSILQNISLYVLQKIIL